MPSTSSSPEPFMRANHPNPAPRCQTVRASNGRQCVWHKELCDANEGHHDGIQSFSDAEAEPKDTLPRGGAEGSGGHVHEWGTWECIGLDRAEVWIRRCPCGTSQSRSEKPRELCGSCDAGLPMSCTCPQEPVCTHCQGPHALEDCKGLEEPEAGTPCTCSPRAEVADGFVIHADGCDAIYVPDRTEERVCAHVPGGPDECGCPPSCGCCKVEPAPGFAIPRRPPYAVAYAVEGGAQYEVAVSGDATVVAEDGALMVLHPKKPVLAIVRVQPMNMEESDG